MTNLEDTIKWKPTSEVPNYEVSSGGSVRSLDRIVKGSQGSKRLIRGRVLKPWLNRAGYFVVSLWQDNKKQNFDVHRLVGLAFVGDYPKFDHKDRNSTNNFPSNLRPCTSSENGANTTGRSGTSKFKGVSWDKSRQKWQTHVMVDYKSKFLGRFDSEVDAAKAYNKAAVQYFGEFACINEV